VFALVATGCAGLFAGAALYISLVEHWSRLRAGPAVALAEFRPGFPRARAIQASLAVLGGSSALTAWRDGAGSEWLAVAVLLFGIVGFTLIAVLPVYRRLLDPALHPDAPEASALLVRWGRLHAARSVAGLAAFAAALAGLGRAPP
jgi:hypothetical protein